MFISLDSGVWCVTQHGKSILQSSLCWWDPSLDIWYLESLLTGKMLDKVISQHILLPDLYYKTQLFV